MLPSVTINNLELNRNKLLDEAVFLAIVGRNQIKEDSKITGVFRLQLAVHKLQKVIDKLNKDLLNE